MLLEPSSGNTGISLAMICRLRGLPLTVVMPANVTAERRQMLSIYGAQIVDSPADRGSNGAVRAGAQDGGRRPALRHARPVLQPRQPARPLRDHGGRDPRRCCPEIDVFVAGLGTGGTLTGVGRRLREEKPSARVYAAEPMPGEMVQGLRSLDEGFVPEVLRCIRARRPLPGDTEESIEALRRLTAEEGIFAGVSSGGVLVVASRIAAEMESGTIVALLADGGWKYLSEDVWSRDLEDDSLETLNLW